MLNFNHRAKLLNREKKGKEQMIHMTLKMPEDNRHKMNTGYRQTFCMSHYKQMGLFNHKRSFKHLSKNLRTKKQEEMSDTYCWESQKNKNKLLKAQHTALFLLTALPMKIRNMLLNASFSNPYWLTDKMVR